MLFAILVAAAVLLMWATAAAARHIRQARRLTTSIRQGHLDRSAFKTNA